jgi:site-specific recombinase XerD
MRTIQILDSIPEDHWIKKYHQRLHDQDLSPLTIRGYTYDLMHFRQWLLETHNNEPKIAKITTTDIAAYRYYLIDTKRMKAASVNRRIQAVKKCFSWANDNDFTKTNLAKNIRFMKCSNRYRPKSLKKKEVHALLRVAGQSTHGLAKRNYALTQLLLQTGLRIGEVADLKLSDITIHQRSGVIHIRHGKGLKQRDIPLNAAVRRALSSYIQTKGNVCPKDSLFHSKRNNSISVRTLQATIFQIAKRAHINRIGVSAHTLRHTFAINYLKANTGKLVELASIMGHESLETVAVYTRPSQEDLSKDLERSPINVY